MHIPYELPAVQQHPETGLQFRTWNNAAAPTGRLLLLHGVGGNETNLAAVAERLPPGLEIFSLRGPYQLSAQGFAWFQVGFEPTGPVINANQAEASRQRLVNFIASMPPKPTVIAGFSQGGILSASVGLTVPTAVRGFGLLSGRILPELEGQIAPVEELRFLSAFVAHGKHDDKLPVKWAELADAWLARLEVPHQTRIYDMRHEITAEEIVDFNQWLGPLVGVV